MARSLCLALLLLAAGIGGLMLLALDDAPLGFEMPKITATEKRRIVEVLKRRLRLEKDLQRLRLTERDINSILAIAISQSSVDGKARATIDRGRFATEFSLRTPFRSSAFRYLNVQGACQLEVTSGRLKANPERLWIGRVPIPKFVQNACLPLVVSKLLEDRDIARGVALIESLRLTPGAGEMVYRSGDYQRSNVHSLLAKILQKPDMRMETEIHIRHLIDVAKTLPPGEKRFVAFVQTAFEFARIRSEKRNPVRGEPRRNSGAGHSAGAPACRDPGGAGHGRRTARAGPPLGWPSDSARSGGLDQAFLRQRRSDPRVQQRHE